MTGVIAPTYVHTDSGPVFYDVGVDIPDEHLALIGAHLFEGGVRPEVEVPEDGGDDERPNGRHGLDRWRAYAESKGIEVPEGADKDAVVALVEASEKVTPEAGPGAGNGPAE